MTGAETQKHLRWRRSYLHRSGTNLNRRLGFQSVTAAGRYLFVFGSYPEAAYRKISTYVFDLCQKEWSEIVLEDAPCQRFGHTATLVDDKIYLVGGTHVGYLKDVHIYDIALNAWSECVVEKEIFPHIYTHTAHFAERFGKILVVCGITTEFGYSGNVYALETEKTLWTQCKPKGQGPTCYFHASCIGSNKIYVTGGLAPNQTQATMESVYVFDFSYGLRQCAWSSIEVNGFPYRIHYGGAMVYLQQEKILYLGGESLHPRQNFSALEGFLYLYDLRANSVEMIRERGAVTCSGHAPGKRRNFGLAQLHSKVLVFGGCDKEADPMFELDISPLC